MPCLKETTWKGSMAQRRWILVYHPPFTKIYHQGGWRLLRRLATDSRSFSRCIHGRNEPPALPTGPWPILHRDPGTTTLQQACEVSPAMRPAMMPQSVGCWLWLAGGRWHSGFLGTDLETFFGISKIYIDRYSHTRIITFLVYRESMIPYKPLFATCILGWRVDARFTSYQIKKAMFGVKCFPFMHPQN